jgi:glutathione S-transferase
MARPALALARSRRPPSERLDARHEASYDGFQHLAGREIAMIEVHHLEHSRSQRILWLLEELGVAYELVHYKRDPATRFAPPELKAIHPLGKSPVIRDGTLVVAESGAIVEYLVGRYDDGQLAPKADFASSNYVSYLHWLHFAEGSAMVPLLLRLYVGRLKEAGAPLWPRIESELDNHFAYMSGALGDRDYFVGNRFSAADIQLSFVLDAGEARGPIRNYPNLLSLHERLRARPAYRRALERGGPYQLAR